MKAARQGCLVSNQANRWMMHPRVEYSHHYPSIYSSLQTVGLAHACPCQREGLVWGPCQNWFGKGLARIFHTSLHYSQKQHHFKGRRIALQGKLAAHLLRTCVGAVWGNIKACARGLQRWAANGVAQYSLHQHQFSQHRTASGFTSMNGSS